MSGFSGPNIISDSLVLYLDAANQSSYPGTGSTWIDLTTLKNNATLVGQIFSGNTMTFNNNSVTLGYKPSLLPNSITLESWVYSNSFAAGWHGIYSNMPSWGTGFGQQIGTTQNIAATISGQYLRTSWTPSLYTWYNIVSTHNTSSNLCTLYVNGQYENSNTIAVSFSTNAVSEVGAFYTGTSLPFIGQIPILKLYNRDLSLSEVNQNYNSIKSRFGL